jgi:phenylacetate-CoA ligase
MADSILKRLYRHAPVPLQNLGISLKGYQLRHRRFGGDFDDVLAATETRDEWDRAALQSYQRDRLSAFLETADEAPFWRSRFEEHGVDPSGERPFEELAKLPVLTKPEVKNAQESLRPASIDEDSLYDCHTSGTTGSGLQFTQTKSAIQEQWAVWWRYRRRFGLDRETWCGYFGGRPIVPVEDGEPPFWRVNAAGRQVMFSTYHLSPQTVDTYVAEIRERELEWLHGYPSALSLLATVAEDRGVEPPSSVEVVTTGAETLFDHQRAAIERVFDARVHQHYGLAEAVANISECPAGTLHVDEDFAYVEFLSQDGSDGKRIVGTNWSNPAFPLLRYDTGDLATVSKSGCSCGIPGRCVDSLLGRVEDYVVRPNGARVGRLDHIFKDAETVSEGQLYQPSRERVVVRIVPREDYTDRTEAQIRSKTRDRLGADINVDFEYREEIPRTDSGKIKFVVSDVDEANP